MTKNPGLWLRWPLWIQLQHQWCNSLQLRRATNLKRFNKSCKSLSCKSQSCKNQSFNHKSSNHQAFYLNLPLRNQKKSNLIWNQFITSKAKVQEDLINLQHLRATTSLVQDQVVLKKIVHLQQESQCQSKNIHHMFLQIELRHRLLHHSCLNLWGSRSKFKTSSRFSNKILPRDRTCLS